MLILWVENGGSLGWLGVIEDQFGLMPRIMRVLVLVNRNLAAYVCLEFRGERVGDQQLRKQFRI